MTRAKEILEDVFGYKCFRFDQAEIIDALIGGRDVLALMPTGGGKSLCYQIPALLRDGVGVVVSPLIALMQDQVTALEDLALNAACLNSSLDYWEQRQVEGRLQTGTLDLLYIAPEKLLTERTLALLDGVEIALFAIDEAHCVSQWGHDFRPVYRNLSVLAERFASVPRIALTATADRRTQEEITLELRLSAAKQFIASFDRPNIRYTITDGDNAREQLWRFVQTEHPNDAGIVYCLSRKRCEDVADWLTRRGRPALAYHAGLTNEERYGRQNRFLREDGLVIVATIAFGMGIDKPDVRFVAHLNLPKSIEAYYQETGRAGRDGEPANAWMAMRFGDIVTYRQWIQDSDGGDEYKRISVQKLDAIVGLCEMIGCRRKSMLAYFGEDFAAPCGNCDNCLAAPETMDATEDARKALSAVYRTGQIYGTSYVIKVLVGQTNERIERNGHHHLSTFGIGVETTSATWRALFRQLIAVGHLEPTPGGFGGLQLTKRCYALLRGEQSFHLRLRRSKQKPTIPRRRSASVADLGDADKPLFDALRTLRARLAADQNVPPYIICHDRSLREIAVRRPQTCLDLHDISGFGDSKVGRYGDAILETVLEHDAGS